MVSSRCTANTVEIPSRLVKMLKNARWEFPMCNVMTLEPCDNDECEDLEDCFFCNKVDCICDELTDRYKEDDLFD
jgi:hypothetical protein